MPQANGTSGMRAKFTSWPTTTAPAVMKPAWRPMSFTSPIPPRTLRAWEWAPSSTRVQRNTYDHGMLDAGDGH